MDITERLLEVPTMGHDAGCVVEAAEEIKRLRGEMKKHDAWLGQAHVLCSDMGVAHGHIEDRLFEAIGKVHNV